MMMMMMMMMTMTTLVKSAINQIAQKKKLSSSSSLLCEQSCRRIMKIELNQKNSGNSNTYYIWHRFWQQNRIPNYRYDYEKRVCV